LPPTKPRIQWRRTLGVYLADGRLAMSQTARTCAGRKTLHGGQQDLAGRNAAEVLSEWIQANLSEAERRKTRVCLALGAEQTFFTTRVMAEQQEEAPTTEQLLEACGQGTLDPSAAVADFVQFKLAGQAVYSIAACRKSLAEELIGALRDAGVVNACLVPAPWLIPRIAGRSVRPPRSWKTFVLVLVQQAGGLAVLMADNRPVLWRRFKVGQDGLARGIASAVRHIEVYAAQRLGSKGLSGVLLQGRVCKELAEHVQVETKLEIRSCPTDVLSDEDCARAFAETIGKDQSEGLDLFRALRPPPSLRQLFPRKLVVALAGMLGVMALVLGNASGDLEANRVRLRRQCEEHKWAIGKSSTEINKEKETLLREVSAVQKFLSTRVVWSDYLRDLPTRLPTNACLTNVTGVYEMQEAAGKKIERKTSRSLTLRGLAQFADRGKAPKEIDAFLESLREVDMLKRDFPDVSMAEVRWRKDVGGDTAVFTIVALPINKKTRSADMDKAGGSE